MAKRTLNDRIIKALKPAKPGQRYDVMDAALPGFGVRVTDKGTKTFVLVARYPGSRNPTRRALGEYHPPLPDQERGNGSLAEARKKASKWLDLISRGVDPQVEIERERLAEQRKAATTFGAVAEDFIREKCARERRGFEVERIIRRDLLPAWDSRPIADITPVDIVLLLKPIKARGEYAAHAALSTVKRLFGWAVESQVYGIALSPADRLKPKSLIGEKRPRTRVLTDDEIRALWRACQQLGYPYGAIGKMLLLTGSRHREVSEAPWSEFDLAKRTWTIGQDRFKSAVEHVVPLTSDMVALLEGLPRFKRGEHVFSTTAGEKPTMITDKVKQRLDALMAQELGAKSKPWVIHDLRRTARSHLAALRIPDHVAEMVLGHGRKGLQRIYDRHRYQDELREALTLWSARLRDIIEPPPANVVEIKGRKARV
jgi:integrase